jgi:hypothetical protein
MKIFLLLFASLILTACGGGGSGSDAPAETLPAGETGLGMSPFRSSKVGTLLAGSATGYRSLGPDDPEADLQYQGTFLIANDPMVMLEGVQVTPKKSQFVLVDNDRRGIEETTFISTYFIDSSGYVIQYIYEEKTIPVGDYPTRVVCTPIVLQSIPPFANIGDSGTLGAMDCINVGHQSQQEHNWRVEDAGNGEIHFIIEVTQEMFSQSTGAIESDRVYEAVYKLDAVGSITGLQFTRRTGGRHGLTTFYESS